MPSLCRQPKQATDQTRSPTEAEQDGSRPHEYHQYVVEEEAERQLPEQDRYYTRKEGAEEEREDGRYASKGYEEQVRCWLQRQAGNGWKTLHDDPACCC